MGRERSLSELSTRALLGTRLCDLGLRLQGSELEARAQQIYPELARRGLLFVPHIWLSTEWFSPDGVPGFAIAFYLAHPRLQALEAQQMRQVEGGSPRSFLRLLRHEAGHALDSAYRIHERPDWEQVFGSFDAPYRRHYKPKPYSRRYVRHLENWYAQSHPAEDFAETVAVWLDPGSSWRTRYLGWPAMRKLRYVDRLMRELAGRRPPVRSKKQVEPLHALTQTLAEYYENKRRRYGVNLKHAYERDLKRLFAARKPGANGLGAAIYLQRRSPMLRKAVAEQTGARRYEIDRVLREMIERSEALDLVVRNGLTQTENQRTRRVAVQLARYISAGHDRLAR